MYTATRILFCIALVAALGACGKKEPAAAGVIAQAPLDAAQQSQYDTYCAVCHGAKGTGAPLAGNAADWQPRAAAGMDVLLQHAMEGYKGMPPMGGCFSCSEDDMRALIAHMSGAPPP